MSCRIGYCPSCKRADARICDDICGCCGAFVSDYDHKMIDNQQYRAIVRSNFKKGAHSEKKQSA